MVHTKLSWEGCSQHTQHEAKRGQTSTISCMLPERRMTTFRKQLLGTEGISPFLPVTVWVKRGEEREGQV